MVDTPTPDTDAIDAYFALCLRTRLDGSHLPPWDVRLNGDLARRRAAFQGIALVLASEEGLPDDWPEEVELAIREEARLQALWEPSHRNAVADAIEALHTAEIEALAMKGTALAYSVYSDPAIRRRGDTDLLVETTDRKRVRSALEGAGFALREKLVLQEAWSRKSRDGFVHEIDLHWRINASPAVSGAWEADHPRSRSRPLPSLSPSARGLSPTDSFIQTCINRRAHRGFGYLVGEEKIEGGDRLIWALDLHLLAQDFEASDWRQLIETANVVGAGEIVASGMNFAQRSLATDFPDEVRNALAHSGRMSDYFAAPSTAQRLAMDVAASRSMSAIAALLSGHLFPPRSFFTERDPGAARGSLAWLRARRLLDAGVRMLLGRRR